MNNRVAKNVQTPENDNISEHYVRDASGNTLATYRNGALAELSIYGGSRLGTFYFEADSGALQLGKRTYDLSNHLGNVLATITDNKVLENNNFVARVVSQQDYTCYGAILEGRKYTISSSQDPRYTFNGKELDRTTGWQDYGFRDYQTVYKRFV
jgi:hypothetical protein